MFVLVVALLGCPAVRTGAPLGTKISVQEFSVPSDAVVQRYSGSPQAVGMRYAQVLADRLTTLGYEAIALPKGVPLSGDLIVTGTIAEIDGGNTAKRLLIGFGAGRSEFDLYGTVARQDGTIVGQFTESRAGGGWSEQGALKKAMERTAKMVAKMIYTGHYQQDAPQGRPAAKAFATNQAQPGPSTAGESEAVERPTAPVGE